MRRKEKFIEKEIFHICNKSIANFKIFNKTESCLRFLEILEYYNDFKIVKSFSDYLNINKKYDYRGLLHLKKKPRVKFLCFCIMPDHYHLLLKIISKDFSLFISRVENSYSRYFNLKHKRKGPLWQSSFKAVRIVSNVQLLHVSRYIHLNPTSKCLVNKPEDWQFSSYKDYVSNDIFFKKTFKEISISNTKSYMKFVEDQQDYQKKLKQIKNLLLD